MPVASGIVWLECLVATYRTANFTLAAKYNAFFASCEMAPISQETCDLAARIRAESNLKLPDALHIAIAEIQSCDEFWTCDADFVRLQERGPVRVNYTPV